jgi:hypothetical protein
MRLRSGLAALILATTVGACSSDSDDSQDAGGTESDAGDMDASAPDAMPGDAAPADAGEDAAPDAAPTVDAAVPDCGRIKCDCTFNGIPLYGLVEYVDENEFPMIRVRVSMFPDLNVFEGPFADECGEWEIVENFPDFTVAIVDNLEDFDIAYSMFPGIP